MAAELFVSDVSVGWDEPETGVKSLLREIRPDWAQDNVILKPLTGGFQNKIVLCLQDSAAREEDGIVFRIFGDYSKIYSVDKDREIQNLQLLNRAGQGSPLVARFSNGYVVRFVVGEKLAAEQCGDPNITRLIAEEIARMHSASGHDGFQPIRDKTCSSGDLNHFEAIIRKCLQSMREGFGHEKIDKRIKENIDVDEYQKEYDRVLGKLKALNMDTRLSHNDVGPGNFIYNQKEDVVKLVDFESCDVNFAGFDLNKIFTFTTGFPLDASKIAPDDVIKTFLTQYLRKRREMENVTDDVTEEDVERLFKETYNCFLLSLVMMSIFIPTVERNNIKNGTDVDYTSMSLNYWREYQKRKDSLYETL